MDITLQTFHKFCLPSTITPRYASKSTFSEAALQGKNLNDLLVLADYPLLHPDSNEAFPWEIKVMIETSTETNLLASPSHKIKIDKVNDGLALITLDPAENYKPNKDFVLLFSTKNINKPNLTLSKNLIGHLSFIPKFNNLTTDNAYQEYVASNFDDLGEMADSKGEFIFLLDRSGSMSGDRIIMSKEALVFFLKSLPPDSYFNVVSFGSDFKFLFPESIANSDETLDQALKEIEKYDADMGGTELFRPLERIYKFKAINEYPRKIFLLTDGCVYNTKQITNLILQNASHTNVYSLGIGNGCSSELIRETARMGRGNFEFVQDSVNISSKAIWLLQCSISPKIQNFILEYEKKDFEWIAPNPEKMMAVGIDEQLNFYFKLKENVEKTKIKLSWDELRQGIKNINLNYS